MIAELVARGHRVSYAIPQSFAPIVASSGAIPQLYESALPDELKGEQWPSEIVEAVALFLDEAIRVLPQLRSAFAADRPDLVLYDIAVYPARVLAHHWGVPLIQLSPATVAWEGYEQDMAEAYSPVYKNPPGQAYLARFAAWLDAEGVPLVPANTELHRWVPQLAVLGHASAFVTHAGMGGCSEGLYQGVPMIAVPQAVDQFANAAMLEKLGVGVHLPPEQVRPPTLRAAFDSLVGSSEVASRSAALREEVRASGGAARAADLIEAEIPR